MNHRTSGNRRRYSLRRKRVFYASKKISKKLSLKVLVEDNSKLISTIGIFTALTIFSTNLEIKFFAEFFSFIFLFIVILLWLELLEEFPSTATNWKLIAFENIITLFVLFLVVYWLVEYRTLFRQFLVIPLTVSILTIVSFVIKKEKLLAWADKPEKRFKTLRYLLLFFFLVVSFIISVYIADLISHPINKVLDKIKVELNTEINNLSTSTNPKDD